MGKLKHAISVAVLTVVATAGLYFLFSWMFARPEAASTQAEAIEPLFQAHFLVIAFLFAFIMVIMLYAVVVFRRRPGDDSDGPHIHGHTGLEIAWTVLPIIIVVGFGIYGLILFREVVAKQDNEMVVSVTAQQWAWSFEYPDAEVKSNRLVLPVDQPILFEMESKDVIHSFWVPEFRVKQDVVPGSVMPLRITPTEIGTYRLVCAEICGQNHAGMIAEVEVVSQADFEQFLLDSAFRYADMTPEDRGEQFYTQLGCAGCHSPDGTARVGPTWQGIYLREVQLDDGTTVIADDEYIRNSILNPNAQIVQGFSANGMPPTFAAQIDELQAQVLDSEGTELDVIADIIAYMQTLEQ
jgi:cytochrome c oxidase subunit II